MSREIKFRAWDKKRKEWYGASDPSSLTFYGFHIFGECHTFCQPPLDELENIIISQYTGLKDKNGNKIFIGDLVKFINPMPIEPKEEIAEVKFVLEDSFLPYIYPFVNISSYNYETKHFEGFGINSKDCEVIGNIYENPELLNKGE